MIAALAALGFAACVKAPPRSALQPPQAGDERWLGEVRGRALKSLKSYAQVKAEHGNQSQSFDAAIVMQAPDRLKIEVINDLGETLLRLDADGERVVYENLREGTRDEIAQSQLAFQKVFKLPLSLEEFIAVLSRLIPDAPIVGVGETSGHREIELPQDRLEIDTATGQLLSWEKLKAKGQSSKVRYRVSYSDYGMQDGVMVPSQIVWQFMRPKVRVTLRLETGSAVQFH